MHREGLKGFKQHNYVDFLINPYPADHACCRS